MSKLYEYEQISDALIDSGLQRKELQTALAAINKLKPKAVIRECDGCMGGAFLDCEECERMKIND